MQLISMDKLHPFDTVRDGHHYALTAICMLTGIQLVPPKDKAC